MMWRTSRAACGVVCACAGACVPDRSVVAVREDCLEQMDEDIYHHACQHGQLGPYTPAEAVAVSTLALPTGDAAQRVLVVRLPPRDFDPDGRSYLRYAATRTGQHAVFAGEGGRPVAIALLHEGRQLPATPIEPVPDAVRCGGMRDVTGFELVAGDDYVVALGPTNAAELRVFIEHLPTFGHQWSDRCID